MNYASQEMTVSRAIETDFRRNFLSHAEINGVRRALCSTDLWVGSFRRCRMHRQDGKRTDSTRFQPADLPLAR